MEFVVFPIGISIGTGSPGLIDQGTSSRPELDRILTIEQMVELQPIFKRAYWTLAAGGLFYVSLIVAMTYPAVQRL